MLIACLYVIYTRQKRNANFSLIYLLVMIFSFLFIASIVARFFISDLQFLLWLFIIFNTIMITYLWIVWSQADFRKSKIGLPDRKPVSAMLAYSCNGKFSQNVLDLSKFYRTCPLVLGILESLVSRISNNGVLEIVQIGVKIILHILWIVHM